MIVAIIVALGGIAGAGAGYLSLSQPDGELETPQARFAWAVWRLSWIVICALLGMVVAFVLAKQATAPIITKETP